MPEAKSQPCSACQTPIPEGARFCPGCATPVHSPPAQDDIQTPPDVEAADPAAPAAPPTAEQAIGPGTVIEGKYEVRGVLGTGGFGEVFRIHHRLLGMECALKVIHSHLLRSSRIRERFFREARVLMQISHPNVATIRDVGDWRGRVYMVMDLCLGQTLAAILAARHRIPAKLAATWATPVLSALGHAHERGLIHRDLKPSNLILTQAGAGKWTIKILDFGLAKILREDEQGQPRKLSADGSAVGTPLYMSPEQINGKTPAGGPVDGRADLYAVGVILYELVTGQRPCQGQTTEEIYKQILFDPPPTFASLGLSDELPGLEAIILQALSKDPGKRPQTAAEMSSRLIALLAPAAPAGAGPRPGPAALPVPAGPGAMPAPAEKPPPAATPAPESTRPTAPRKPTSPPASPPQTASVDTQSGGAPAPTPAPPASPPIARPPAPQPRPTRREVRPPAAPAPVPKTAQVPVRRSRWVPAAAALAVVAIAGAGLLYFRPSDRGTPAVPPGPGPTPGGDAAAREKEARFAAAVKAGEEARARGEWETAQARFAEALQLKPQDAQVQARAGEAEQALGRARAEKQYGQRMEEGRALAAQGKWSEARTAFELAAKAKPADEAVKGALAELAQGERFSTAMKDGEAALAGGDPETAQTRFAEALQAKPGDAAAQARADAAQQAVARKRKEAEERGALAQREKEYGARMQEGRSLAGQGKWEEAKAAYEKALTAKPDDPAAKGALEEAARGATDQRFAAALKAGEDALAGGDPDAAEARFAEALQVKPGDAQAQARAAAAHAAAEARRKELAAGAAAAAAEKEYRSRLDEGNRLKELGRWPEARTAYELALKAKPGDPVAKEAQAEVARRELEQRFDAAMKTGEEALARGDPDTAQARFTEATRLKPADATAQARLAAARTAAEQKRKAAAAPAAHEIAPAGPITLASLTDAGKNDAGLREYRHEPTGITFVLLPAGEFTMGSQTEEVGRSVDEDPHKVRITRAFLIGKTEVTNGQFRRFRATHSSGDQKGQSLNGDDQPVVNVSWADAAAFCAAAGMRLPTEAEWEYAARGNQRAQVFPWGKEWPPRKGAGNLAGEELRKAFPDWSAKQVIEGYEDGYPVTAPVGQFKSNPFGLFDLAGNVWEWCADWYTTSLGTSTVDDPTGPAAGDRRVLRGGAWNSELRKYTRSAARSKNAPGAGSTNIGFRVAATVESR